MTIPSWTKNVIASGKATVVIHRLRFILKLFTSIMVIGIGSITSVGYAQVEEQEGNL
jgi:hypothetical protein